MKTWKQQDGNPDTVSRRAAAKDFLEKTLADTTGTLWDSVVRDPDTAWKEFRAKGDIDIPKEVKVICVDPNLIERDKVVVFIMPPKASPASQQIDPLAHWVAAWPPYGQLGGAQAASSKAGPPNPKA